MFALQQALESYRHYSAQLEQMEVRIEALVERLAAEVVKPDDDSDGGCGGGDRKPVKVPREKWHRRLQLRLWICIWCGPDCDSRDWVETALLLLAELGHDFSEFGNVKKLSHWLGLTPGTNISGGKRLSGAKGRGSQVAGQALRMSAMTLKNSPMRLGRQASAALHPDGFAAGDEGDCA